MEIPICFLPQVRDVFHAPIAALIKGAVVLTEDQFCDILPIVWELLLESNQELVATAAGLFIVAAVRAPTAASDLMHYQLQHAEPAVRIAAIQRYLWFVKALRHCGAAHTPVTIQSKYCYREIDRTWDCPHLPFTSRYNDSILF